MARAKGKVLFHVSGHGNIGDLGTEVYRLFREYGDEVAQMLRYEAEQVLDEALPKIKAKSPKRPNMGAKYSKGWRKKLVLLSRHSFDGTIYNATNYQLTHLLEHGHEIVTPDGVHHGRVEPSPEGGHILPLQEWAAEEVYKRTIDWFK